MSVNNFPWESHPGIVKHINKSWTILTDYDLSQDIYRDYDIKINPEQIRNLRRKEGWIKVTTNNQSSENKFKKVVFVGDFHIPFHDYKLFELFIQFIKYFKPDKCFIIGDLLDCYSVSTFDKDPARIGNLQIEIDLAQNIIDKIFKLCKDITFLEGNHEWRITRHLRRNPELYGLDCLSIASLLRLADKDIKCHSYMNPPLKYHKFQVTHGNIVRKYSGWTAKALWEKYAGCGICGHSHRGGNFIKRNTQGIFAWYENMCMSSLEPEYLDFADWQQGWSIAYFTKKDLFHLEQIPVIKHQFLFQGRMFSI